MLDIVGRFRPGRKPVDAKTGLKATIRPLLTRGQSKLSRENAFVDGRG
jgi:hypothetical protein